MRVHIVGLIDPFKVGAKLVDKGLEATYIGSGTVEVFGIVTLEDLCNLVSWLGAKYYIDYNEAGGILRLVKAVK